MKKFTLIILVCLIGSFFPPKITNVIASDCVPSVFSWDFGSIQTLYEVEIISQKIYDTKTVIVAPNSDDSHSYEMDLYSFNAIVKNNLKGNATEGEQIEIREVPTEKGDPITTSLAPSHYLPKTNLYKIEGETMLMKLQEMENFYQSPYVTSNDICNSPYINIKNILERYIPPYEFWTENGTLLETENSTFKEYVNYNFLNGLDFGFPNKSTAPHHLPYFFLDESIERADVVNSLFGAGQFKLTNNINTPEELFPDVPSNLIESLYKNTNERTYSYPKDTSKIIHEFNSKKIVSGFSDGTFKPNNPITRAEATKIIVNVLREIGQVDENATYYTHNFPDVDASNKFVEYISILNTIEIEGEKLMKGYQDGTFRPDNNITRGEFSKIVALIHQLQ